MLSVEYNKKKKQNSSVFFYVMYAFVLYIKCFLFLFLFFIFLPLTCCVDELTIAKSFFFPTVEQTHSVSMEKQPLDEVQRLNECK